MQCRVEFVEFGRLLVLFWLVPLHQNAIPKLPHLIQIGTKHLFDRGFVFELDVAVGVSGVYFDYLNRPKHFKKGRNGLFIQKGAVDALDVDGRFLVNLDLPPTLHCARNSPLNLAYLPAAKTLQNQASEGIREVAGGFRRA